MSRLEAVKKQYAENSATRKPKTKHVFNKDVYFSTYLPDGVNSAQKQIRIVEPLGENDSPFVEIHGHSKQVDGKWTKFICPKEERGEPCPFCEARELLLAAGTAESKEEAKAFSSKKMYVVKVIDRDNPEHGVKFWRFNHHYKNAGTFDKINAANSGLPVSEDPYSAVNGRDLIITINKDGKNSVVTGINYNMSQTPLSEDAEQAKAWLDYAHNKDWSDGIFSVKPYDYLEIIVRGGTPKWEKNEDGNGGHYVDAVKPNATPNSTPSEPHDNELSMGIANANAVETKTTNTPVESAIPEGQSTPVDTTNTTEATNSNSAVVEDDDDLPF